MTDETPMLGNNTLQVKSSVESHEENCGVTRVVSVLSPVC